MVTDLTACPLVHRTTGVVYARANWGAWIADCITQFCFSAYLIEPGKPFECARCGLLADIVWPADKATIEALLMLRPDPRTRNWSRTETTTDLMFENYVNGVAQVEHPELEASRSHLVMDLTGDGLPSIVLLDEPLTIDRVFTPAEIEG